MKIYNYSRRLACGSRGLRMALIEQSRKEGWHRKGATEDYPGKTKLCLGAPPFVID